jgi:hypothetical protein
MLPTGVRTKSTFVRDWVNSGTTPGGNLELSKKLQDMVQSNPERGAALVKYLENFDAEYKGIWTNFANVAWHMLPETWELKEDIEFALRDIANYVQNLHITTSTTSD